MGKKQGGKVGGAVKTEVSKPRSGGGPTSMDRKKYGRNLAGVKYQQGKL